MNRPTPQRDGCHVEIGAMPYRGRASRWWFWVGVGRTYTADSGEEWDCWRSLIVCGLRITFVTSWSMT